MLLLSSELISIFQNILIKNKASLTKQAFILACSNEDLSMIKILVNVARDRNELQDPEAPCPQNKKWQEWLFGKDNPFCAQILKQEQNNKLSQYLNVLCAEILKREPNSELSQHLLKIKMEKSSYDRRIKARKTKEKCYLENMESKNTKLIYNLQSSDKHDRRLKVLFLLNMTKNIELLIINDKKTKSLLLDKGTPLHYAVDANYEEVVKFLLENNSDSNSVDISNRTPLHISARNGHFHITKLLLEHKSNSNALDHYNESPLHCAAYCGHKEIVKILVEFHADRNLRNIHGRTASEVAKGRLNYDVVRILESGMSAARSPRNQLKGFKL